ncbi:CoA transferase [Nesterenkonia muleiensis]|uniref:CoA transferase n=1 Tax=Nesterenkonia muleiensis TaxID=2282648 RepID=UPI00130069B8|nr:CoA transferase [Nesterenkonia muleiensis]
MAPFAGRQPGLHRSLALHGDGKLSIAVDLKFEQCREKLRALIAVSGVLLTSHPPRRRREYGLDWETGRELNPQAASGVCDIYAKFLGRPRFAS